MAMNAIYFDKANGMQNFIPAQKILLALCCWKRYECHWMIQLTTCSK